MEDDASHAESGSSTGSTHALTPQQQQQQPAPENQEIITPSLSPSSAPSSPSATSTLSRLGLKSPTSPPAGAAPGGQVSAITVVALLDKLKTMLEAVQDNQQRMEQRQADLENAVRVVQGDVTRLSKVHVATSGSVGKLLERSRKVSGGLKEVKDRLDRQAVQVKKLEANHSHLLKRNHFKVIISQDENEIPTTVMVKDSLKTPLPSLYDAESTHPTPSVAGSVDPLRTHDEALQTISLSSDEDLSVIHREDDEMLEDEAAGIAPIQFERRADRFKRNSLKKVDSLKKAFTRQSIEKKMAQITTKIVPPEKREKLKKSLTPNHTKSPTSKSSSFKVSPMTFTVKKVRAGEVPTPENVSPEKDAHVEIPVLGGLDGESSMAEVHTLEDAAKKIQETLSPTANQSAKVDVSINGKASSVELNGEHLAGLAVPEQMEDGEDEEEEEKDEEKQESADETTPNKTTENETTANETAVDKTTVDAPVATGAVAVEQVS
ncbi:Serum deprivation-response protein [Oryzias melastigma]|uniref:Serum deprivation-response protein n=1 Tax=Oryzias melastigma TaxID=30732 RepID=A0A834L245_ORYME|nr:Serum deprivation-response protein [Oryzias melastigma]